MALMRATDRLRILAWYDHAGLVAARRPGVDFVGTILRVHEVAVSVILSVEVDGVEGAFDFRPGDVEPAREPSFRLDTEPSG